MSAVRVECRTCHRLKESRRRGPCSGGPRRDVHTCATTPRPWKSSRPITSSCGLRCRRSRRPPPTRREALKAANSTEKQQARLAVELAAIEHDIELLRTGNDVHNMHYATKLNEAMVDRLCAFCRELKVPEPEVVLPPPLPKQHP